MIDTVRLSHRLVRLPELKNIEQLSKSEESTTKGPVYRGRLRNMRINICGESIRLGGSLNKFRHGDNITPMLRSDVKDAFEELSELLALDLSSASIHRLDVGYTFSIRSGATALVGELLSLPRHRVLRSEGESVTFLNTRRSIVIYDKTVEQRWRGRVAQGGAITNLIRYELQLKSHLREQLGGAVFARDLHDEGFFARLVRLWSDWFRRIVKNSESSVDQNRLGVKEVVDSLVRYAVAHGGWSPLLQQLVACRETGLLSDRKFYRICERVRRAAGGASVGSGSGATSELSESIEMVEREWV